VTGLNASIGREALAGLEYIVKALNATGGAKIGADTYTLAPESVDDKSEPKRAT